MLKLKESAPDEHIHPTAFRLVGHPVDTSLEVRFPLPIRRTSLNSNSFNELRSHSR